MIEIRSLVPPSCWRHCPGTQNPADIPSRGVSSQEFQDKMMLWLHGPSLPTQDHSKKMVTPPRECISEMRTRKDKSTTTLITQVFPTALLQCEDYSCLKRLIRITAYVLKLVNAVRACRVQLITPVTSTVPSLLKTFTWLSRIGSRSHSPLCWKQETSISGRHSSGSTKMTLTSGIVGED